MGKKEKGYVQYTVSLNLTKEDGDGFPNFMSKGSGWTPYEAVIEASKTALTFYFGVDARRVEDSIYDDDDDDEIGKFHRVKEEIKSQSKKLMKMVKDIDEDYRDEIEQLKLKTNYLEETVEKLNKQISKKDLKIRELQCQVTKKQKATGVERKSK